MSGVMKTCVVKFIRQGVGISLVRPHLAERALYLDAYEDRIY